MSKGRAAFVKSLFGAAGRAFQSPGLRRARRNARSGGQIDMKPLLNSSIRLISPVVKPNPKLVSQNAARLANTPMAKSTLSKILGRSAQVAGRIANVPKGEAFRQRPISNSLRLISLDGIPGVRRLAQANILATAGVAGKNYLDIRRGVNDTVSEYQKNFGLSDEKAEELRAGLTQDITGYALTQPWRNIKRTFGLMPSSVVQTREDTANRSALLAKLKGNFENPSPISWARRNRTPMTAAANQAMHYVAGEGDFSDATAMYGRNATDLMYGYADQTDLSRLGQSIFKRINSSIDPKYQQFTQHIPTAAKPVGGATREYEPYVRPIVNLNTDNPLFNRALGVYQDYQLGKQREIDQSYNSPEARRARHEFWGEQAEIN